MLENFATTTKQQQVIEVVKTHSVNINLTYTNSHRRSQIEEVTDTLPFHLCAL